MEELTRLIREDMKPALGVTEPGAIAFAVASAKKHTSGEVKHVKVALNSGMYKNAFTCGIPGSARFGNLYAAALGAVAANADKGLQSLEDITREDDEQAARMVEQGMVEAVLDHIGSEITIDAWWRRSRTLVQCVSVEVIPILRRLRRTAYVSGVRKRRRRGKPGEKRERKFQKIHKYTLHEIFTYIKKVPEEEIRFIQEAFSMNLELLEEGLESGRAVSRRAAAQRKMAERGSPGTV